MSPKNRTVIHNKKNNKNNTKLFFPISSLGLTSYCAGFCFNKPIGFDEIVEVIISKADAEKLKSGEYQVFYTGSEYICPTKKQPVRGPCSVCLATALKNENLWWKPAHCSCPVCREAKPFANNLVVDDKDILSKSEHLILYKE